MENIKKNAAFLITILPKQKSQHGLKPCWDAKISSVIPPNFTRACARAFIPVPLTGEVRSGLLGLLALSPACIPKGIFNLTAPVRLSPSRTRSRAAWGLLFSSALLIVLHLFFLLSRAGACSTHALNLLALQCTLEGRKGQRARSRDAPDLSSCDFFRDFCAAASCILACPEQCRSRALRFDFPALNAAASPSGFTPVTTRHKLRSTFRSHFFML